MLEFFKKLFGAKPAETPAPYKVETPSFPVEKEEAKPAKAKKPAVKKATTRKPRAPKA
jgi:SepF-like predicted cell division protein (DUF552 family)